LNDIAIAVENMEYVYQPHDVKAVRGITFHIWKGEFVGIIGQNGAGKTTLLKNILGLLIPTSGRILVNGIDTRDVTVAEQATRVGFVLQNPDQQLFAQTVVEEIAFGPHNLGLSEDDIHERVEEAISLTKLDMFRDSFPPALPKGDRAKVVIASVLAMRPEILILDEPTTGQDYKGCHQIMQIARGLHEKGRTVLVVTHHMALVSEYTERTIALCQGEILLDDATEVVFSQPTVLLQTQVTPPQITQLAMALPRELEMPTAALTVTQLGDPILQRASERERLKKV